MGATITSLLNAEDASIKVYNNKPEREIAL